MEELNNTVLFILLLTVLAFSFNLYKYDLFINTLLHSVPYGIFPWSAHPQISSSSPIWLCVHLTSALLHILITGFRSFNYLQGWPDQGPIHTVFIISHYIFAFIVIINVWHFGEYSKVVALIINVSPLALMFHGLRINNHKLYFLA